MQGVYANGLTRGQHRTGSKSDVYDCFAIIIIIIIIIILAHQHKACRQLKIMQEMTAVGD